MKTLAIGFAGGCVVCIVVWIMMGNNAAAKIADANRRLAEYKAMYDSTKKTADSLDGIVDTLMLTKAGYRRTIDSMQVVVATLEKQQKEQFYRIAGMFEPDSIVDQVKVMFPKFRNAPMGLIDVKSPRTGLEVTSYYLPVQLVSSFIEDRQELLKAREKEGVLKGMNVTYEAYLSLQDTIISLKEQKAQAFLRGFQDGMKRYDALNKDYITELKKPKLSFGLPTIGTVIGSAALGYVACRETHNNP